MHNNIILWPVYNHNNKTQNFWDGGKKRIPDLIFFLKMENGTVIFWTKRTTSWNRIHILLRDSNKHFLFFYSLNKRFVFWFLEITTVKTVKREHLIRPEHNIILYPTINNKCKRKKKKWYILYDLSSVFIKYSRIKYLI